VVGSSPRDVSWYSWRNKPDPCGGCWITDLNGYCR
jgi:hypothetical protein